MRKIRFIIFIFALFFICFWFSGGNTLVTGSNAPMAAAVQTKLNEAMPPGSQAAETAAVLSSGYEKASRMINLPAAVEKNIRRNTKAYIPLEQMGTPIQQAIIAVEDNRFYTHSGFDVEAMLRAALVNLQLGKIDEGASTITQQLVKNLFLSQERSFGRKAEEFMLAIDMEMQYPKEKILELYLNTIYFGSGFYGIYDASMGYFGKPPSELNLAEASMLAGLPNAPSLYSPYVDFSAAKHRQAIVLGTMVKAGYINPSLAERTKQEDLLLAH